MTYTLPRLFTIWQSLLRFFNVPIELTTFIFLLVGIYL
jgi:hypothetical protein